MFPLRGFPSVTPLEVLGSFKCLFGLIACLLGMIHIKGLQVLRRWKNGCHDLKGDYKMGIFLQYIVFSFLRKEK